VEVPSPEGIGGIQCPSRSVCYGINSLSGAVARSTDGGETWHQRTRVPKPGMEILEAMISTSRSPGVSDGLARTLPPGLLGVEDPG